MRLCRPKRPDAAVIVGAYNDAYVSQKSVRELAQHWPGSQVCIHLPQSGQQQAAPLSSAGCERVKNALLLGAHLPHGLIVIRILLSIDVTLPQVPFEGPMH